MSDITFLRKRDETHGKARMLKATDVDIERYERIASQFGPRTTLLNSEAYDVIWWVGLHSLAQGRPLIPTNAENWAGEVWVRLCHLHVISSWDAGPMVEIRMTAIALWGEL